MTHSIRRTFTFRLAVLLMVLLALRAISTTVRAQAVAQENQAGNAIDSKERQQVVEGVLNALKKAYVFPEVATKMETSIRQRLEKHEYDAIVKGGELAKTLTAHLQEISHDKHLRVTYSADQQPRMTQRAPTAKER